jgi:hypothetical protein
MSGEKGLLVNGVEKVGGPGRLEGYSIQKHRQCPGTRNESSWLKRQSAVQLYVQNIKKERRSEDG